MTHYIRLSIAFFILIFTQCGKQEKLHLSTPPTGYRYQIRYNDEISFRDVKSNTVTLENEKYIEIQLVKTESDKYYLNSDYNDSEFIKGYYPSILKIDLDMMRDSGVSDITITPDKRAKKIKVSVENSSDYLTIFMNDKPIGACNEKDVDFWIDELEPSELYVFYTGIPDYDTLIYNNFDELPYKFKIPLKKKSKVNINLNIRDKYNNPISNVEVLLGKISLGKTNSQGYVEGTYTLDLNKKYFLKILSDNYVLPDTAIITTKLNENINLDLTAYGKVSFNLSIMDKYTGQNLGNCEVLYKNKIIGKSDREGHVFVQLLEKEVGRKVVFKIKKQHWKDEEVNIMITGLKKYERKVYLKEEPFFSISLKDALTQKPLGNILIETEDGNSVRTDNNGRAKIYISGTFPYETEIRFHSDDNLFNDFTKSYSAKENRRNFTEIIPTKLKLIFRFQDTNGNPVKNVSFLFNKKPYNSGSSSVKTIIEALDKTIIPLNIDEEYYKRIKKDLDISQTRDFKIALEPLYINVICESHSKPVGNIYIYIEGDKKNKVRTDQHGKANIRVKKLNEKCKLVVNDPERNFEDKTLEITPTVNNINKKISLKPLPVFLVEVYDPNLHEIGGIPVFIDSVRQGETDNKGKLKIILDSFKDYINVAIKPNRFQPIKRKVYINAYPHTEQFQLSYLTGYFHALNSVTGKEIANFEVTWKGNTKNSIPATKKIAWALDYVPLKMNYSAQSPGMDPLTNQTCEFRSKNSDSNHVVIKFRPSKKKVRIRFTDQTGNVLSDAEVHATLLNQIEAHFVDAFTNIKKKGIISMDLYPYKYRLNYTVTLEGQPVSDVDSIDVSEINERDNIHKKIVVLNMTRLIIITDNDVNVIVKSMNDALIGEITRARWENDLERNTQYKIFLEKDGQMLPQGEILATGNEMVLRYPWKPSIYPILDGYINNKEYYKADQLLKDNLAKAKKQNWYSNITFRLGNGFKSIKTIEAEKKSVYWLTEAVYATNSRIKKKNDILSIFRRASNIGMGYQSIQLFEKLYSLISTGVEANDKQGYINEILELWTYALRNNLETEYSRGTNVDKIMKFLYCPVDGGNNDSGNNIGDISEADLWLRQLNSYIELAKRNKEVGLTFSFILNRIEQLRRENPEPSEGYRCQ